MPASRRIPATFGALAAVALAVLGVLGLAGHATGGQRALQTEVSTVALNTGSSSAVLRSQVRPAAPQAVPHAPAADDVAALVLDVPVVGALVPTTAGSSAHGSGPQDTTSRGPPTGR